MPEEIHQRPKYVRLAAAESEMHLRCEGVPPAAKILVPSEMHLKPEEVHLAAAEMQLAFRNAPEA